jgi:subtilisin family serine protease
MNHSLIWHRTLTILLVVGLLLGASQPAISQPPDPERSPDPSHTIEVEPELLSLFESQSSSGYLIYFKEKADLSPAFDMDWEERGWFVMKSLQETAAQSQEQVIAYLEGQNARYQPFWIDNLIVVEKSDAKTFNGLIAFPEIEALRAEREIYLIEPVEENSTTVMPMGIESNLDHIGAPDVWADGIRGEGIVVASIDSGVRYTHQALVNQYRGNLGGGVFSHDHNWLNPYTNSAAPADTHSPGHGTHVTGTMVGDDGGANQIGVAPDAKWIACAGFNPNSTTEGLIKCAEFMAAPTRTNGTAPDPSMRPHVVNNSWGSCSGKAYDDWYQSVVDAWVAAGIYPMWANGNQSTIPSCPVAHGSVGNPARYGNVSGVGALGTSNATLATYSLWGPSDVADTTNPRGYPMVKPQFSAPGTNRSAVRSSDSAYGNMSGTSMAAPHAAGLVALMWSAAPCLVGDYSTTETIIEMTTTDTIRTSYSPHASDGPGGLPNQATGWGEINTPAAVEMAIDSCGKITGVISDAVTSDPIEGALVTVSDGSVTRTGTSGPDGQYSVIVREGTFEVSAAKSGYLTTTITGITVENPAGVVLDIELEPSQLASIKGTVTGLGYCDANPVQLQDAVVSVLSNDGTTNWAVNTGVDGGYQIWLEDQHKPFTVTASYEAGYLEKSIENVEIIGQDVTELDFDLRLLAACLEVEQDSMDVSLPAGSQITLTLTLANHGAGVLEWTTVESEGVLVALDNHTQIQAEPENPATVPATGPALLSSQTSGVGESIAATFPALTAEDISLVLDDGTHENAVGIFGGGQFVWFNRFTPDANVFPFKLNEIWIMYRPGTGINVGDLVDFYVYQDPDGDPTNGADFIASVKNAAVQAVSGTTWSVYELDNPILVSGPGDVLIAVVNRTAGILDKQYPAAIDQTSSQGRSWVGIYDGDPADPPVFPAPSFGTIDSKGIPGNWMVRGYGSFGCEESDISWLMADPTEGFLAADSSLDLPVTFNATGLEIGAYTASLCLETNDPFNKYISIPVSMTVVEPLRGVELSAQEIDLNGAPGATIEYTLTITNSGNVLDTYDLSLVGGAWEAELEQDEITLGAAESGIFKISVDIPAGLAHNASDSRTVRAVSRIDPEILAEVALTTRVNQWRLFLPAIQR